VLNLLEWTGCAFGLIGAAMLALNNKYSGWGFVAFLISNGFWIAFGIQTQTMGLILMQVGFTITSLMGVWNWLICRQKMIAVTE